MVPVAAGSVWRVTGIEPGRAGMLTGFAGLSTPLAADACVRRKVPLRVAPPGIGAVRSPGGRSPVVRCRPATHGSVDVFLEAFGRAGHGDVLVAGNGGRSQMRPCLATWSALGRHRRRAWAGWWYGGCTATRRQLTRIGLPVFSYRRCPAGPVRLDEREPSALVSARFGLQPGSTGADIVAGARAATASCRRTTMLPGRAGGEKSWPQPARSPGRTGPAHRKIQAGQTPAPA